MKWFRWLSLIFMGLILLSCDKDSNKNGQESLGSGSFQGSWKGTGDVKIGAETTPCESVEFQWNQTADMIEVLKGEYKCGDLQSSWDPLKADIIGNKIIVEGQQIGTIVGSTVDITIQESGDSWRVQATAFSNQVTIVETSYVKDLDLTMVFTGNMVPAP